MTRVSPDTVLGRTDVMLRKAIEPQEQRVVNTVTSAISVEESLSPSLNYVERCGQPGIKEVLGSYPRISTITFLITVSTSLLILSGVYLFLTEWTDYRWLRIVSGEDRFPALAKPKAKTYFEGTKLKDTPVGKLIHHRTNWKSHNVDFGFARGIGLQSTQLIILLIVVLCCLFHLLSACCFTRCRRQFQLISLSYGFIGLLVFTLSLTTLYFGFVHKVASFLENAQYPRDDNQTSSADNLTINYFVKMSYACAFAFSIPNSYVKSEYDAGRPFPEDSSFTIENVTYSRLEMMELGICPSQHYLLASVVLLVSTTASSWIVASYSEHLENKILGPPVWLQRFKIKTHKGIRYWQTRKKIPSRLENNVDGGDESGNVHDDYRGSPSITVETSSGLKRGTPTWVDAYDILDGGVDHIMLIDPLTNKGASKHKLYGSPSKEVQPQPPSTKR